MEPGHRRAAAPAGLVHRPDRTRATGYHSLATAA